MYRTELKEKVGKRLSRVGCIPVLCQEAAGEGMGARAAGHGALPGASVQYGAGETR